MSRVTAAIGLCLVMASQPVFAQDNSEAEALNDEGKKLFKEQRYLEAYKRFKQATAISPQGKYYFNVCFALNYLERFEEAVDACEQVEPNGADAMLIEKTQALLEALRAKIPQNPNPGVPDPNATDPDPNNPDPAGPGSAAADPNLSGTTAPGPAQAFSVEKQATGAYAWSLGASLGPFANLGIGSSDAEDEFYGGGGLRLNIFGNFIYKEAQRIGLQGYLGYSNLAPTEPDISDALDILDFGAAAYKHIALTDSLDITPLAGVHVSLMQPEADLDEALLALGFRGQLSLDWAIGSAKEHVVSFSPTINFYSPAANGNALEADDYGLDAGGASLEFGIGYQYRFTTPFGAGPIFELE